MLRKLRNASLHGSTRLHNRNYVLECVYDGLKMNHPIFIAMSALARARNNRQIHSSTCLLNNKNALEFNTEKFSLNQRNRSEGRKTLCEFDIDVASQNIKITSYAKDGRIEDARQVFDKMTKRTIVSWNAMITGYACNARINEARQLFDDMAERDVVSWNAMISGYVRNGRLEVARQLFDKIPERDVVSWDCMISGYARGGRMEDACQLFDRMPGKNLITWNAMLAGYAQIRRIEDTQHLFENMPERDAVSWNTMITAYAQSGRMLEARQLFDAMQGKNTVSWNVMITGYAQKGEMLDARQLFDTMPVRDVVTWTSMVTGYAQNGNIGDARELFENMPERNIISWNAMIAGYAQNGRMEDASHLFSSMPSRNVSSWNAMIAGYAQNGQIGDSRRLFDELPNRDNLSWTVMIAGYAQNDHGEEALKLFSQMKHSGFTPVESTFTCVLSACASLAALEQGKQLHAISIKTGFEPGVFVGNAIVTMYCKCGSIGDAYFLFDMMPKRDVISWNAIIAGYAQHGCGKEALQLFEQMQQMGTKPNRVTFIGVLSACSHAGLVNKGLHYFHSMSEDYGIAATVEHYACMVDLFGRAGHLVEAEDFVNNMRIEPNARVKMQERSAGGVIHLDDSSLQRYAKAKSRPYSLLIFFDAVQMRDNAELRLQDLRAEFKLMASTFIANNPGATKLFFCDLEFTESRSTFAMMDVNALPHIRHVGPGNAGLKDSEPMDMSRGSTAESMAAYVEAKTGLRVGEIERPSAISKKQLLFVGGVVLLAAPYVIKKLLTQQTPLHDPKVWLASAIFVYFFSVSGAMYNIIRKMPLFMADRNDPSKLLFFYQGSGMQLGAEGFAVGFLYTVVGLMLAFVTHFLVYVRNQNTQRLLMLVAMALSFWAVKKVISLDNWKTGYAIHGFWPSSSH